MPLIALSRLAQIYAVELAQGDHESRTGWLACARSR